MRDQENINKVADLHPDYLGFIFFEGSPRYVSETVEVKDPAIRKTGVFVDASGAFVLEKAEEFKLSAIQLHGNESKDYCRALKKKLSEEIQLIKVFGVKDEFEFSILKDYEEVVDLFLFDTKGKNKGGHGITFNWEILKKYPSSVPFFLSGGIGVEEVPAIKDLYDYFEKNKMQHLFYGLDVNSRFETAPGVKDPEKLKIFKDRLLS
ncbi:phosphoribosylanthranilate isomerase [Salinimicrobium flavum]|uniref:N-(5'-phosphoribosyl)anthranilate isomerase n=1 Tax=Salinimicrobium flavum TaxID=1737065 RepID=A0ABW5IUH9_9FLAO